VERLSVTEGSCHRFDTSTAYVVERILFSERPTGCLGQCVRSANDLKLSDNRRKRTYK